MVHSHMAPYTGEAGKYSMHSSPWRTHLLQLWERNEPGRVAAGGQALDTDAVDAPLLCTKTTAKVQRKVMVSCPSGPSSKDHPGQATPA